jgi:predicted metal-dependent phosphoesterase TrpH
MAEFKADFHIHTSEDTVDGLIPYSAKDIVDRAAELGFGALSVTNHTKVFFSLELADYAASKGVVLIPGIECAIEGKHVIALNASPDIEDVSTFAGLRAHKAANPGMVVVASHPFYPHRICLNEELERNKDLFDAVEYSSVYTGVIKGFNEKARAFAERHGKTLLGGSDSHSPFMFGRTHTVMSCAKNSAEILSCIRENKNIRLVTKPWPLWVFLPMMLKLRTGYLFARVRDCLRA